MAFFQKLIKKLYGLWGKVVHLLQRAAQSASNSVEHLFKALTQKFLKVTNQDQNILTQGPDFSVTKTGR